MSFVIGIFNKNIEIKYEQNRVLILDYLKGFSIITIVLMHLIQGYIRELPSSVLMMSSVGGSGVHVFFVCSAIGLYISYINNKQTIREFTKKRLLKIYIPYVAVVFASFCVPWMYNGDDKEMALISHIFLFKMFVSKYEESFGMHFWFISTIIQLYLIFIPMCKVKERIKDWRIFFSLFLLVSLCWWILLSVLGFESQRVWNSFFLQYIWEFALGILIAEVLLITGSITVNYLTLGISAIIGIGLQSIMALFSDSLRVLNDIPAFVGYVAIALFLYYIPIIRWMCYKVSVCSYELYLVHILVFTIIYEFANPNGLYEEIIMALAAFLISILIAIIYNKIIKCSRCFLNYFGKIKK